MKSSDSGTSSHPSSWLRSVLEPVLVAGPIFVTHGTVHLRTLIELVEKVAHAAHRSNIDAEWLELLAHAMHVDFDRVAADVIAKTEQVVDDLLLADYAPLARQQQFRQRELACGHLDGLLVVE